MYIRAPIPFCWQSQQNGPIRLQRQAQSEKFWVVTNGKFTVVTNTLARGALYHLLQNRIYRGEIVHKEQSYPGEHAAIVDETLWKQVQRKLATNRAERTSGTNAAEPSLLAGLVYDDTGQRMTPSHANKQGTRYGIVRRIRIELEKRNL